MIPARGGSKGIPRKNVTLLNGRPLIHYAIATAKEVGVDEIWVSTDDGEIRYISLRKGVHVLDRPEELGRDDSTSESALLHFAGKVEFDVIVFIQCTSPLVKAQYIKLGLDCVVSGKYDSAFSVCETEHFIWKGHDKVYPIQSHYADSLGDRPRRQDREKNQIYRLETGAFYITTRKALLESKSRISGWIKAVETPFWQSFEVDSIEDLKMIERLMRE